MDFDDEFDKTLVSRKPWENYLLAGKSALKKGKLKSAEAYLTKAFNEASKFGDDDPRIGNISNTLAEFYIKKRDMDQAEFYYQNSISILSKAFGDD
jgi:tetratricopeptide (TPR) repeat protein